MINVAVYGSSGQARSVAEILIGQNKHSLNIVAFIDDTVESEQKLNELPVVNFDQWSIDYQDTKVIIGVGAPKSKMMLAEKILLAGGNFLGPMWEKSIGLMSGVAIGVGSYIGYGTYVGPGCTFGDHVSIMTNISIGHDVMIGSYSTICPLAGISGNVIIEEGVFIGVGAIIINGSATKPLIIGRGATVAAGAVVTKSVAAGETVMGNPARSLRAVAAERRRRS